MQISLLEHTHLSNCALAIRECWGSQDKGGCYNSPTDELTPSDIALLDRVINKHNHASTAEHLVYRFNITGISRACLQELCRHRIASLSVRSSRYTLTELRKELPFTEYTDMQDQEYLASGRERAEKYLVMTSDERVNRMSILALDNLRDLILCGISNDLAKYALPEAYKTSVAYTINARSLKNFLQLRSSKQALWEIRDLAAALFNALPTEHKFLFSASLSNINDALPSDAQSLVSHCIKASHDS